MILVERTFHLQNGNADKFLNRLSECYDDLQSDSSIQTYAVLKKENEINDVIIRFILTESANWEDRMEQDYVASFLADTSDYTESIDTSFQDVVKFYTH